MTLMRLAHRLAALGVAQYDTMAVDRCGTASKPADA
jgi:hypothetical protein